jgi:hypothetical protein
MTPETRLAIAEIALDNYLTLAKERGKDLPSTDIFSEAVQRALLQFFPDYEEKLKLCPLRDNIYCTRERCAWWSTKANRCGMLPLPTVTTIERKE